jgi:hypothetical protein
MTSASTSAAVARITAAISSSLIAILGSATSPAALARRATSVALSNAAAWNSLSSESSTTIPIPSDPLWVSDSSIVSQTVSTVA